MSANGDRTGQGSGRNAQRWRSMVVDGTRKATISKSTGGNPVRVRLSPRALTCGQQVRGWHLIGHRSPLFARYAPKYAHFAAGGCLRPRRSSFGNTTNIIYVG